MYVDRRGWVLLCMPKTGTTTARYVCERLGDGSSAWPRVHLAAHEWRHFLERNAPDWADELPADVRVHGTIREPLAWYGSVYRYTLVRYGERGVRWLTDWTHGDAGSPPTFAECLWAWTRNGSLPLAPAEEMLNPDPSSSMPTLYQAAVSHYYGANVDGWVRLERQAEDLGALLDVTAHRVAAMGIRNATKKTDAHESARHAALAESDRAFWRGLLSMGARL